MPTSTPTEVPTSTPTEVPTSTPTIKPTVIAGITRSEDTKKSAVIGGVVGGFGGLFLLFFLLFFCFCSRRRKDKEDKTYRTLEMVHKDDSDIEEKVEDIPVAVTYPNAEPTSTIPVFVPPMPPPLKVLAAKEKEFVCDEP